MSYGALTLYQSVMGITPGPHNLMCMYLCAEKGIKGAYRFIIGSIIGYTVKCLLCGFLNLVLASFIPKLMPVLKWVGCAYMVYLAVHLLISGWKEEPEEKAGAKTDGKTTYGSGLLLQVVNVKSWIACLSVFSVYVIPFTSAASAIIITVLISTLCVIIASILWGGCGQVMSSVYRKYKKAFCVIFALSLLYCAVTAVI